MMTGFKFDTAKLLKLNDPGRFDTLRPDVMWDALGRPDAHTIVEIGAGTGIFSAKFAELAPHATVFAADVEPEMLDWMRDNREEVASGRMVVLPSEERHVPLDDDVADLVVMINLHHELDDPAAIYGEAFRMAAEGGQVMVVDWAPGDTPKGPPQEVRASVEQIEQALTEAGFSDVRAHEGLPWHSLVTGRKV